MHLVLPFAGASPPDAAQAAAALSLTRLERLLALLTPGARDRGDELSLSPPHERVLAAARGWPLADGLLPLAALAATADGLLSLPADSRTATGLPATAPGDAEPGWGLLSPSHWQLGSDQVLLVDPATLALDEADSRTLFATLQPLFSDDGWSLHWGAADRWYARHPSLATLPTASLDRVVGRPVDRWMNSHPDARRVRRLQAEAQMLLHGHPVNERREAQGRLPVNSFWLSGTGPTPAAGAATDGVAGLQVDLRLRAPALAADWTAWAEAWAELDAGPLQQALVLATAGAPVAITLCGERDAQRFDLRPRPVWQRWLGRRRVAVAPLLEGL